MPNTIFDDEIQPRLNRAAEELGQHYSAMRIQVVDYSSPEFVDELIALARFNWSPFPIPIIWSNIDLTEGVRHFERTLYGQHPCTI